MRPVPSMRRWGGVALVAVALGALFACGDSAGDAGRTDAGGATDAGYDANRPPSNWDCVGNVVWPAVVEPMPTFQISFLEFTTELQFADAIAGVTVEACEGDPSCATPLATTTTDAMGVAEVTMPISGVGFQGFFRLTHADYVPAYLFLLPPIYSRNVRWTGPWVLFRPGSLTALVTSTGKTIDPTKGHMIVLASDCNYLLFSGAGATGELDVTVAGHAPDVVDDYETVFVNVDPGTVDIVATRRATGQVVGQTRRFVVAGALTQGVIGPTPLEGTAP